MKHNIKVGDKVKFQHTHQSMAVVAVHKKWFSHDYVSTVYQLPDKTMSILNNINPNALRVVKEPSL